MNHHNHLINQLAEEIGAFKRQMMGWRDQLLGELQLTRTQVEVLMLLSEAESQTVGDLAGRLSVTNSAATQTIETLVKRGLVERLPDEHDRRIVRTRLSVSGKTLSTELHASRRQRMDRVFGSLSDAELELMISVMKKLSAQVDSQSQTNKQETPNAD